MGLRPTGCDAVAFTNFATPAPKPAASHGNPTGQDAQISHPFWTADTRYALTHTIYHRFYAVRIEQLGQLGILKSPSMDQAVVPGALKHGLGRADKSARLVLKNFRSVIP